MDQNCHFADFSKNMLELKKFIYRDEKMVEVFKMKNNETKIEKEKIAGLFGVY